jgi:hypothetical protein
MALVYGLGALLLLSLLALGRSGEVGGGALGPRVF